MKNIKLILKIVLAIVLAFMLYFIFSQGSQLKKAEGIIENVNQELNLLKDSLQSTQKTLDDALHQLDYTGHQLNIYKKEREVLELEEQKKRARNWEELQNLKQQIIKIESERDSLRVVAKKFEL